MNALTKARIWWALHAIGSIASFALAVSCALLLAAGSGSVASSVVLIALGVGLGAGNARMWRDAHVKCRSLAAQAEQDGSDRG